MHAAAARGLHIFCEKPLAMDYPEGRAMVAAVEQRRRAVADRSGAALLRRLHRHARRCSATRAPGQPLAVVFRDDQCFPIRGVHDSAWRADRTLTAGGTLIEHGVHDLDLLTWFFGPVARLRAWEQNRAGHPGIEDYMAVELEFADGLRAQLVNVWHNMVQRPSNRRLEIFCDNAFIASDADMSGDVIHQFGDGPEQMHAGSTRCCVASSRCRQTCRTRCAIATASSYLVQDLAFVEALLAGRSPTPDIRVGLEAQRLAAAAYHAARSGEEVDVATFRPQRRVEREVTAWRT